MCLIGVAWKCHPEFRLIVAANRDEFYDRPTRAAAWWPDHSHVFGGRDERAGGTWMAVTADGRWGAVTNVRRDGAVEVGPADARPSRGKLVCDFVVGDSSAGHYVRVMQWLRPLGTAPSPAGFNLLVADRDELWWCDDMGGLRRLPPGVHTVSNASPNTVWPKTAAMNDALQRALPLDAGAMRAALFDALDDRTLADPADVPDTSLPAERARQLSAAMIVTDDYGTRASSVVTVGIDGMVTMHERTRDRTGATVATRDSGAAAT